MTVAAFFQPIPYMFPASHEVTGSDDPIDYVDFVVSVVFVDFIDFIDFVGFAGSIEMNFPTTLPCTDPNPILC